METLSQLTPVLTAAGMREADRITIEEIGIPGFTLMESAGREAAEVAQEMFEVFLEGRVSRKDYNDRDESVPPQGHIVCICGKGNNGGDGLVIARYLSDYGHRVSVVLMADPSAYSGDAATNLGILRVVSGRQNVEILAFESVAGLANLPRPDLVIDALLGTGLASVVLSPLADVIAWMNEQEAPVLSVDIPSGLSSDSGCIQGVATKAHVTVTMGALKAGLLLGDGPECVGALHVVGIGIPSFVIDDQCKGGREIRVSNDEFVRDHLPAKNRQSHKYAHGPSLVIGGSTEYSGAPVLAALGAARSGSGYIVCICPPAIHDLLQEKLTEIPVHSWVSGVNGPDVDALISSLGSKWLKAKSLVIGPGLGRDAGVTRFVKAILSRFEGPVVVDADALFALKDDQKWVREHSDGRWIFTPHEGEFRFLGGDLSTGSDRIESARAFAKDWNVTILLKGQPCITASPSGRVVINSTGNPGVATAGTGDVLAGVITGMLAQGLQPEQAAVCGIHVAGTAADLYVEEHAIASLMAGDLLETLPRSLALLA